MSDTPAEPAAAEPAAAIAAPTQTTPAPGSPVDPQIAALRGEIEAIEGALRTARNIRIGLGILLVLFISVTAFSFMQLVHRLQSKPNVDRLVEAAKARYEARLPLIQKELTALVDESSPVVMQAFYEQSKKDLPAFADSLKAQRDPLVEALKEPLRKRLYAAYDNLIDDNQKVFEELVPDAAKPGTKERIVAHLHKAVDRMIDQYYLGQLEGLTSLLFESWDAFPPAVQMAGSPPLEDALLGNVLELANYKLAAVEGGAETPDLVLRPISKRTGGKTVIDKEPSVEPRDPPQTGAEEDTEKVDPKAATDPKAAASGATASPLTQPIAGGKAD